MAATGSFRTIMVQSHAAVGSRRCLLRYAQGRGATRLRRRDLMIRMPRAPRRLNSLFGGGNKETNKDKTKNPFSNFSELLKTAQDAQLRASVEAQKAQEELSKVEFEGYDDEEMVRVVVTGNQEPKSVELTESVMELELGDLEERLVQAMKEAHSKSVIGMKDRMQQLYSDLGFPMPPQQ